MPYLAIAVVLVLAQVQAPDIPVPVLKAPTQVAAETSPAELQTLRAGVALFQQQRFDEAIAKYKEVLDANPKSQSAMYEIALALFQKKDYAASIDMCIRATDLAGPEISKVYALIGSSFDMMNAPKKAIEVYDAAIALHPGAGTLHYNKAVTEFQTLKDVDAAVKTLKRGAVADPRHALTQSMLAQYYFSKGLKTPAFVALTRMLILEPASPRTVNAYRSWYGLLNNGMKTNASGQKEIGLNPDQSKEEGDLLQLDLHLALSAVSAAGLPEGTTVPERLVTQVDQLISLWTGKDPADATPFLWTYYMPYFKELREKKLVRPFIYYISQNVGMAGAREWAAGHADEIQAFVAWDKAYQFKAAPPRF